MTMATKTEYQFIAAPLVNSSPALPVIGAKTDVIAPESSPEKREAERLKKANQRRNARLGLVTINATTTLPRDDLDMALFNFAMSPESHEDDEVVQCAIASIRACDGEVDPRSQAAILSFWLTEHIQRWTKKVSP